MEGSNRFPDRRRIPTCEARHGDFGQPRFRRLDGIALQLSFHRKLLLLLFFISDLDINIFAHLFQKCKDSLDLALGVFHSALRLIDVIQNCPVCKEAIKEEICEFQKNCLPQPEGLR